MKSAEWSKAPVLKTGERASVPWVRIPPSPPLKKWIVQDKSMKKLLLYIIVVFFSLCSNILAFEEDHLNNLLNNKDCMQCDFSGANLSDIKIQNI